jgi:hypothetical protein
MRSISISARRLLQRLTEMHLGLLPGWDSTDEPDRTCIGCRRGAGDTMLITGRREGLCRDCAESAALGLARPVAGAPLAKVQCAFCAATAASERRFQLWPDGAICDSCIGLSLQIFAADGRPAERHWPT